MRRICRRFLGAAPDRLRRESGQVIAIVAVCMVVFVGAIGIVVDVGHLYLVQRQLQTSTDAAVLAAAQDLPDGDLATSTACEYSSDALGDVCNVTYTMSADGKNYVSGLTGVETTVQLKCLSFATAGTQCKVSSGCPEGVALPPSGTSAGGCNAVTVRQQARVTPWFMGLLGFGGQNVVSASATASMAGGVPHPLDIEVVLDSTGSMEDHCTAPVPGIPASLTTKLDCAKAGVRALLGSLYPCPLTLTDCGLPNLATHNVNEPLDRVGLMTFPATRNSLPLPAPSGAFTPVNRVVTQETDCIDNVGSSNITYDPLQNPNYHVVPFSSDYRASATATSLNKDSPLVQSIWWKHCPGGVYPAGGGGGSSSIVGGGPGDRNGASNGTGIAGGPGAANDRSGASNGAGLAGGPASANDRSSVSNYLGIGAGPSGSSDRSGASNGSGIGGGPAGTNDRSGASNYPGGIGGGSGSGNDRTGATNGAGIAGGPAGANDRSGASNYPGVIGGDPANANDRSGATNSGAIAGGPGSSVTAAAQATAAGAPSISIGRPTNRGGR